MASLPTMKEFRSEATADGIVHLIFDMPGRSMNVFSNAAIHEILTFASWLEGSDARGVVVRSAKATGFCAGADLGELGIAYDMIMAAPREKRFALASEHFAPIGRAFRMLETAGKPVAAAINGLALGGGCELALGCHYRVMADTPQTALGLPESLVGLFPGGGGTQRMPRLVGLEASLPILLDGARLSARQAVAAGAAHEAAEPGSEVAAAERWVRSNPDPRQPWDRDDWKPPAVPDVSATTGAVRAKIAAETGGHYPAPLAILDCVERGLPSDFDTGMTAELASFARLIQRPEPRNMIQTLFLGRLDFEKRRKAGTLPSGLETVKQDVAAAIASEVKRVGRIQLESAAQAAGFAKPLPEGNGSGTFTSALNSDAGAGAESAGLWFEAPTTDVQRQGARLLGLAALAASAHVEGLSEDDQRLADHTIVRDIGFPAYLGGPFSLLRYLGSDRLRKLLSD